MKDKKTLGIFIKEKRIEKNYSQKELAKLLFVTEWAVSKWERGLSYPDITLIPSLCEVLEVSEHELITASIDTESREIKKDAYKFHTIRNIWFFIPTISYIIAILTCFICNIAVNHTLSWFFVVLTGCLCGYSFVPTFTYFVKKQKFLFFILTSFMSIILLLFTCAVYTKTMYWFTIASIGTLMLYILIFLPIILLKTKVKKITFLITFVITFLLTVLLLININVIWPFSIVPAILITCYSFIPVFICCGVCLLTFDSFIKSGVCVLICTITYYLIGGIINILFNLNQNYYDINFNNWKQHTSANIQFIILLSLLFICTVFATIGIIRIKRKSKV